MSPQEARIILGVSADADEEDIRDFYEEAVFEQASFFMRRVFLPQLALKRLEKLGLLNEAMESLEFHVESETVEMPEINPNLPKEIEELVGEYNRVKTRLKLILANTTNGRQAERALKSWLRTFETYARRFLEIYGGERAEAKSVKLSEAPIFDRYAGASREERIKLEMTEFARLKRLMG